MNENQEKMVNSKFAIGIKNGVKAGLAVVGYLIGIAVVAPLVVPVAKLCCRWVVWIWNHLPF